MKKYFSILGLSKNANYQEIKNARNNLLKKYHPDHYQGDIEYAKKKSAEINDAYEKLVNYINNKNLNIAENKSGINNKKFKKKQRIKQENIFFSYIKSIHKKIKVWLKNKKYEIHLNKENKRTNEQKIKSEVKDNKNKTYIKNTIIEDERAKELKDRKILDVTISFLVILLIVLVIMFITGAISWMKMRKKLEI